MSDSDSSCCPPSAGSFSWNELIATDTTAANEFYCKLFDWTSAPFAVAGESSYFVFKRNSDDVTVAGLAKPMNADAPTHWVPYIVVDNIDNTVAKASEMGAFILVPTMPVPEIGRIAVLRDPSGATFGVHELIKP